MTAKYNKLNINQNYIFKHILRCNIFQIKKNIYVYITNNTNQIAIYL